MSLFDSREFWKYSAAAAVAFVADYSVFLLLTAWVNLYYLVSATLSFIMGMAITYLLSVYWVFTDQQITDPQIKFSLFALIGIIGLVLSNIILWLLVEKVTLTYAESKLVATFIVLFWNFTARKWLLF